MRASVCWSTYVLTWSSHLCCSYILQVPVGSKCVVAAAPGYSRSE
uniref:Uncharacterized protein n=1 Tax=Anguilla anguilla TaxID=7936 RepID=A0A0E9XP86_ANGAN